MLKFTLLCLLSSYVRGFNANRNQTPRLKLTQSFSSLSMVTSKPSNIIPPQWYEDMLEWALDGNDSAPLVTIQPSMTNQGHGLYAARDFNADEVLFEIPANKCLSLEQAWNHPHLGKSLRTLAEGSNDIHAGNIAVLAAYLAIELVNDARAEFEDNSILESPYSPYLKTLLTGIKGVTVLDHVLHWSSSDVDVLFSGTLAHEKVVALRHWVGVQSKVILDLLMNDLFDNEISVSESQVATIIILAFISVLGRSFQDDDKFGIRGLQMMVPVLDMAHYSHDPNIKCRITTTNSVVVQAARDIQEGQELVIGSPTEESELQEIEFFVSVGLIPKKSPTFDYEKALQKKEMPPWLITKILQN
mmetsp:Transcript_14085/g.21999  ORF Transcript_14085/g.21999 Transcript_14085/m.21999 type:complete len:359 (+) Transcript_14085:106-1182(+)